MCRSFSFFNDPPPTVIYTLSLHDALPICLILSIGRLQRGALGEIGDRFGSRIVNAKERIEPRDVQHVAKQIDRKSTRLNSSHVSISYAVFCLKKKNKKSK